MKKSNDKITPLLATTGYIDLREGATLDAPLLATTGNIDLSSGATLDAPLLATTSNIDLSSGATLDAPLLATTGNIDLSSGATLKTKLTKKLNYKSVDGLMFIIESQKTSKGIKIFSGYHLKSFKKKEIEKEICFVAEKENYYAHGKTVKQAIGDLNFKIVSEKLKKEPIQKDTEFTVQYYRTLTGACYFGIRSFMEQNNIPFTLIKNTNNENTD